MKQTPQNKYRNSITLTHLVEAFVNDLHILKPDWTSPEKLNEQAMVYMLIHEEDKWGELNKRTKYKYKNLIKEISPVDLTELMKSTLRENEKQLQKQIEFWQTKGKKLF